MAQKLTMESGPREGPRTVLERVSRPAVFYELTKPGITGTVYVDALCL